MRRLAAIGVAMLLLSACGWMQPGYDAGHSNANRWENHVTLANVATLEDHVVPPPDPTRRIQAIITVNGRLIVGDGTNIYAYGTGTCPTADASPCPLLWTAPGGSAIASDGHRLFIGDLPGAFPSSGPGITVRDLDGNPLGHLPFGGTRITVDRDVVYTTDTTYSVLPPTGPGPVRYAISHELWSFRADCDPAACDHVTRGSWGGSLLQGWGDFNAGDDVTVADGRAYKLPLRDGVAVGSGPRYDLSDPDCQTPLPACAPDATYSGLRYAGAISPGHVFGIRYDLGATGVTTQSLGWYPDVHTPCPGIPATCDASSVATLAADDSASVAVGGEVVYVGRATGLDAYAEDGASHCTTAVPRICTPVAHFAIGSTGQIQVVDRRVYALGADGLHVLTIPGDVS